MGFSRKKKTEEIIEKKEEEFTVGVEYRIITAVVFLVIFGFIMVYSASSYTASLSEDCNFDGAYYLKKQIMFALIGLGAALFMQVVPYNYKFYNSDRFKGSFPVGIITWLGSFGLIMLLRVDEISVTANNATRWIKIGPFQLQVADAVKMLMIIFLAWVLVKYRRWLNNWRFIVAVQVSVFILCGLLVIVSSNLSSAIVLALMVFVITFVAARDYRVHAVFFILGVACVVAVIAYCLATMPEDSDALNEVSIYQLQRVYAWLDPERFPRGQGYQPLQSLYAIGGGGLFGKGLGNGTQKLGNIPEASNDMIFSIICEELGVVGALLMFFMYAYLLYQMYVIIRESHNMFGSLLVLGVMLHIGFQVIVNVAVATNSFPNTGVSLPFISSGGSAMVCTLVEIGMVIGVRRQQVKKRRKEMEKLA